MAVSRRNTIISHGGRHGAPRTLRKGAALTKQDEQAIPAVIRRDVTKASPKSSTGGKPNHRESPLINTDKRVDPRKLAKRAAGPSVPDSKVISNQGGGQDESPPAREGSETGTSENKLIPTDEGIKEEQEIADPVKKRDLTLLRKADVEALAAKHDIVVDESTPGRTELLRDLIAAKLGL